MVVGGEQGLDPIPKLRLNNGLMLARICCVLVDDLAAINTIGQDAIEMAAAKGLSSEASAARAGVTLGAMAFGLQNLRQLGDCAELRVAAEYVLHEHGFGLIHDELALPGLIAEGRCATIDHLMSSLS